MISKKSETTGAINLACSSATGLIFVGAMRVVFSAAAVALGDVGRSMFDATAIYAPANTAGAVSAMPYSAGSDLSSPIAFE